MDQKTFNAQHGTNFKAAPYEHNAQAVLVYNLYLKNCGKWGYAPNNDTTIDIKSQNLNPDQVKQLAVDMVNFMDKWTKENVA